MGGAPPFLSAGGLSLARRGKHALLSQGGRGGPLITVALVAVVVIVLAELAAVVIARMVVIIYATSKS